MHMQQAGVRFLPHLAMAWMLAGALFAAVPRGAQAAEVEGVKLAEQTSVAGQPLVLNGAGARYRAVFKVYVAGLYLPRKTHLVDEILKAGAEPRRLQLTMLRDIDAAEFGKMFYRGMEDNMDRNAFAKLVPGVMRMSQVFTNHKVLKTGENFMLDWIPGTGTVLTVKGQVEGEPFREPEFFEALMRIWLGPKPADWALKDALLGIRK